MADPFISEIRINAFNYAPRGWAACDGATIAIAQNQALFSLLGTTYGGDGRQTFMLPDVRGRVPIHRSQAVPLGATGGENAHTLVGAEVPGSHTHPIQAVTTDGDQNPVLNNSLAAAGLYKKAPATAMTTLNPAMVQPAGGQAHPNQQPFLTLNFCIALQGVYPSRP